MIDTALLDTLTEIVISAFDDASRLVMRIRDQRKGTDRELPDHPTQDLLDSLSLGPVIVRGHFDHDFKRFGEQFACGDAQARENMKDVLLNLQMTLIIALKSSGMDGTDLHFDALQSASDDCRVNAGVCLGQLSQRLSDSARAQAMYPANAMFAEAPPLVPPLAPSLAYSSSRSTRSSTRDPRTPSDNFPERFATMSVSTTRPSIGDRMARGSVVERTHSPPPAQHPGSHMATSNFGGISMRNDTDDKDANDALSMRRPSSHALGPEDEGPSARGNSPPPRNPGRSPRASNGDRQSYGPETSQDLTESFPEIPTVANKRQNTISQDQYGPGDLASGAEGREVHNSNHHDSLRDNEPAPASYVTPAKDTNHSTMEHIKYLQQNGSSHHQGINVFPSPPPTQDLPPPPQPSNKKREDHPRRKRRASGKERQVRTADPLSQFPQPNTSSPPHKNTQSFPQPPVPARRPMQPQPPPQNSAPPIPPLSEHRNSKYTSPPSHPAPAPEVRQLPELPSAASSRSIPPRSSAPQYTFLPARTVQHQHQNQHHAPLAASISNSSSPSKAISPSNSQPDLTPAPTPAPAPAPAPVQYTFLPQTHNSTNPSNDVLHRTQSQASHPPTSLSALPSTNPPTTVPLTLPTEKTPMGFCKSATRLLHSPNSDPKTSRSFTVANRPVGFNSLVPYWSCTKCNFEGPISSIVIVEDTEGKKGIFGGGKKKGREEKIFDGRVRMSIGGGVRYKWAFLAKSHVLLRSHVDHVGGGRPAREGEVGGFGCLFCCAEGTARGWVTAASLSNMSVKSGSSGNSGSTGFDGSARGTPVFGSVQSFMEHLEIHRAEDGWPGAEMRGRMKCIVGKTASSAENWEVNFVPVAGMNGNTATS